MWYACLLCHCFTHSLHTDLTLIWFWLHFKGISFPLCINKCIWIHCFMISVKIWPKQHNKRFCLSNGNFWNWKWSYEIKRNRVVLGFVQAGRFNRIVWGKCIQINEVLIQLSIIKHPYLLVKALVRFSFACSEITKIHRNCCIYFIPIFVSSTEPLTLR